LCTIFFVFKAGRIFTLCNMIEQQSTKLVVFLSFKNKMVKKKRYQGWISFKCTKILKTSLFIFFAWIIKLMYTKTSFMYPKNFVHPKNFFMYTGVHQCTPWRPLVYSKALWMILFITFSNEVNYNNKLEFISKTSTSLS